MGSASHDPPCRPGPLNQATPAPTAPGNPVHGNGTDGLSGAILFSLNDTHGILGPQDELDQDERGREEEEVDHDEERAVYFLENNVLGNIGLPDELYMGEEEGEGEESEGGVDIYEELYEAFYEGPHQDEDQAEDQAEDSLPHAQHIICPFHHLPHHSSHGQDMDADPSDSPGMSDNAAVALVGDIAGQFFVDDVDMNAPAGPLGAHSGLFWPGDAIWSEGSANQSEADINHDPAIAAEAQAATAEAHAEAAAFVSNALQNVTLHHHHAPNIADAFWAHAFPLSNPSPSTIGPCNYGLTDFLHHWARQSRTLQGMSRGRCPWPSRVNALHDAVDDRIGYDDLAGDLCDFQGIDWDDIGVTRRDARERRLLTYTNYVNISGSDRWRPNFPDVTLPRKESFFRFRRMHIKRNVHLSHFQLRHAFASTSRSRVFYPAVGTVQQFNPLSGRGRAVVKLSDAPASQISTLAAGHGVLMAGGFGGEYYLRRLDSDEPEQKACHEGVITSSISGITNHIAVYQSRTSSGPVASFASNDNCIRVMDVATETWLSGETHEFAPNCSALSPDGRLRVTVGDSLDVVITATETKRPSEKADVLQRLSGHRDYGFACDWADDGWTIATAFQDKSVKIWDARRLTDSAGNAVSLCTIRSEMAGVRSLRFSPIGSGRRVLVAAEEADFVNIIDAQTFRSKQTIDVFGELGGISFENGGQDLMVLCCDRTRGGVLQLERCGGGVYEGHDHGDGARSWSRLDWRPSLFTETTRLGANASRRRRKMAASVNMEPF